MFFTRGGVIIEMCTLCYLPHIWSLFNNQKENNQSVSDVPASSNFHQLQLNKDPRFALVESSTSPQLSTHVRHRLRLIGLQEEGVRTIRAADLAQVAFGEDVGIGEPTLPKETWKYNPCL